MATVQNRGQSLSQGHYSTTNQQAIEVYLFFNPPSNVYSAHFIVVKREEPVKVIWHDCAKTNSSWLVYWILLYCDWIKNGGLENVIFFYLYMLIYFIF